MTVSFTFPSVDNETEGSKIVLKWYMYYIWDWQSTITWTEFLLEKIKDYQCHIIFSDTYLTQCSFEFPSEEDYFLFLLQHS